MSDVVIPNVAETARGLQVVASKQYHSTDDLSPSTVAPSPLDQFHAWFTSVQGTVHEPEAMTLCTATASGIPSARMVLLKTLDARGFLFFTNYTSRKSQELEENPHASLVFYWREVHKSVRVSGTVEKVTKQETEEYFRSRPVGSRLGAWASKQSTVVGESDVRERLEKVRAKFGVSEDATIGEVPVPDFWGGWRVVPNEVEFWAGKPSRLHDRVRYLKIEGAADGQPQWKIDRLAP